MKFSPFSPLPLPPSQFGDSQQLRLVRILRSTVMVRVGGGWMALDEFLVKNDPCRVHHHGSKMLRSESNSSITQSPIGWQLSHFLSLLHPGGMCASACACECWPVCGCVCLSLHLLTLSALLYLISEMNCMLFIFIIHPVVDPLPQVWT
ncbi:hypothetical protein JZ751_010886 [Albula glossodonta]|uniref:GAR domain-containing protein n=1 Tax=Albula glossodonta TaxID=121402 RepID=A0A8T2P6D0_9TELE|nr:hypothetical protein JZ751_010886 [Albula glossodonta]